MSKFDGLGAIPINNKFDGLGAIPIENNQQQKEYTAGNRVASLGKSVASGVGGSLPDTASLAYNLPAMGINKLREVAGRSTDRNLPLIPSATQAINESIDNLTDGYTETPEDQKWLNQGVEFASSVAGGGAAAKGLQTMGKTGAATLANVAGTTNKSAIAGAGAAGTTMSVLEDQGASTGESLTGGIAANLGVTNFKSLGKNVARGVGKTTAKMTGLSEKNLNLDAIKAAQELEINLPKAVASDSKVLGYADRFINHAPFAGNIMKDRYAKIGDKILKELDSAYDSVLHKDKLQGIDATINKMYNTAEDLLPEGSTTVPTRTMEAIGEVQQKINAPSQSGDFKKIQTIINDIEKSFTPSGIKGIPAEMQIMVNQKENLNNAFADLKTAKGQYFLKKINDAVKDDIAAYGKSNPEWYKYFSGADNLFAKKATREDLTKLLASKAESATHGEITVGNLSKTLNTAETKDKLKLLVEPEIFDRLEKLGTVTQAFAKKNKNIINPSGTTVAQTTINWVSSVVGLGTGSPLVAGAGIIGASGIAHLLTDKKSLDLAIKLAEKPTEKAAVAFNIRMKQLTGYTPVTLAREASKREEQEQDKQGTSMRKKFNDHIEENKKRPKGQALIKGLSNPTVQKTIDFWHPNTLNE